MTKHNKKRYQSKGAQGPVITATGRVWLEYRDEEEINAAAKGDLKLFPSVEALHTIHRGEYGRTGHAGYFRADIYDGREWRPVVLTELFPRREHYFSKSECPIDTFALCAEKLQALAGIRYRRTYREHYQPEE